MRANDDQLFSDWLLELGKGTLPCPNDALPESIIIPRECNIVEGNIVDAVFGGIAQANFVSTVILTPTNECSLQLNEQVLALLDGEAKTYFSADCANFEGGSHVTSYPVEFLHTITPSGMPPHKLTLKVGAIIMLLRNLDIRMGLCNGTRLIIRRLFTNILDAEIITSVHRGHRVLIPRIKLAPSDVALPFTLQRVQFPIRLAYSMTINKAQGQTFQRLGIYLPTPVFSHGQLYVAFSRARTFDSTYVKVDDMSL